jgi:hypothetical protein
MSVLFASWEPFFLGFETPVWASSELSRILGLLGLSCHKFLRRLPQSHMEILLRNFLHKMLRRLPQSLWDLYSAVEIKFGSATWCSIQASGVRECHTCIGLMKRKFFILKHHFHSCTSVALNMCELNAT